MKINRKIEIGTDNTQSNLYVGINDKNGNYLGEYDFSYCNLRQSYIVTIAEKNKKIIVNKEIDRKDIALIIINALFNDARKDEDFKDILNELFSN